MCTEQTLKKITERVVHSYRSAYGNDIVGIFLYGSYARGNYTDDSDIDIVAVVRGERLTLQDKLKKVWDDAADLGLEYDVVISPMVIPYDEFEKYRTVLPYYRNISEQGIRVE